MVYITITHNINISIGRHIQSGVKTFFKRIGRLPINIINL